MTSSIAVESVQRHATDLLDWLVDNGPATAADVCAALGWSRGRFDSALRQARHHLCRDLGISIPHPTPDTGWQYEATTDWGPVEAGASYSLGQIESRLLGIHRDVGIVLPHLTKGSKEWRRANFLNKHVGHLVSTLTEINGGGS